MKERWERFERSSDAYLSVMGMLLLLILVPILTSAEVFPGRLLTALIAGGAATLAMAASHARAWVIRAAWLAWITSVIVAVIPGDHTEIEAVVGVILGVTLIAAPVVILRRVARHEKVTATTMWGAVSAYLSFGMAFSFIYGAVHRVAPEAFTNVVDGGLGEFNYFSFVTLTTLGYGDITPVYEATRALVVFETLIGQIFLVVVVARVVSLMGSDKSLGGRSGEPG